MTLDETKPSGNASKLAAGTYSYPQVCRAAPPPSTHDPKDPRVAKNLMKNPNVLMVLHLSIRTHSMNHLTLQDQAYASHTYCTSAICQHGCDRESQLR